MKLPLLKDANVSGKRVFLRADLDIPLSNLELRTKDLKLVEDETRLLAWMPTLEYLLKHGSKVIIGGHLGRPRGIEKGLSLEPIVRWLNCHPEFISGSKVMLKQVQHDTTKTKIGDFDGWKLNDNLFLLENLRFYEGEENPTTGSGLEFSRKLASLADIYVNDAFAVCHRAHASIAGVPKYLPHFAGLRLQEEVRVLSSILKNPKRPLVVLIGGAKIETKLPLVEKMHGFADYVLVGGKIAKEAEMLSKIKNKHTEEKQAVLIIGELNKDKTDISNKSVREFLEIIKNAGTVVWNGPIGKISNLKSQISNKDSEYGTLKLAEGIVKSGAYTVVGGGDTIAFLNKVGLIQKFSFVSTGGGAMLAYLSGEKLPGIVALAKT